MQARQQNDGRAGHTAGCCFRLAPQVPLVPQGGSRRFAPASRSKAAVCHAVPCSSPPGLTMSLSRRCERQHHDGVGKPVGDHAQHLRRAMRILLRLPHRIATGQLPSTPCWLFPGSRVRKVVITLPAAIGVVTRFRLHEAPSIEAAPGQLTLASPGGQLRSASSSVRRGASAVLGVPRDPGRRARGSQDVREIGEVASEFRAIWMR